jgi:hypothetical protein
VVYLVRSFRTNARIRSLTTGTFNRVVKDRIAIRLSGANSGLDGAATRANPAVLETLQTYVAAQDPVNASDSQNFQRFSTLGKPAWSQRRGSSANREAGSSPGLQPDPESQESRWRLTTARNGMAFRFGLKTNASISAHGFLGHSKAEDRKLRKDPTLGGSLLRRYPSETRLSVSESSPVAGTT